MRLSEAVFNQLIALEVQPLCMKKLHGMCLSSALAGALKEAALAVQSAL